MNSSSFSRTLSHTFSSIIRPKSPFRHHFYSRPSPQLHVRPSSLKKKSVPFFFHSTFSPFARVPQHPSISPSPSSFVSLFHNLPHDSHDPDDLVYEELSASGRHPRHHTSPTWPRHRSLKTPSCRYPGGNLGETVTCAGEGGSEGKMGKGRRDGRREGGRR